ncbi:MAG: 30S ribosomal protein S2 [Candidatus Uhrbacteria bacterium]
MPKIPSLEEMLQAGVHFGHKTSRWHPKMEPFIHTARGGVHIINLEETQKQLEEVLKYVSDIATRGGVILFVATKRQAQELIKQYAEEASMPYVCGRWLGGTLTNFGEIRKIVKRYKKLKEQQDKGELSKYTKKERLMISREIADMERKIYGIRDLEVIPDAVLVIDMKVEKTAVEEAAQKNVPVIAVCDTNVNPDKAKMIIPANDDAVKSIQMMLRLISEAIVEGKKAGTQLVNAAAKKSDQVEPALVKSTKKTEDTSDDVDVDDEVEVTEDSKAAMEELDLMLHDKILSEKEEEEKNPGKPSQAQSGKIKK